MTFTIRNALKWWAQDQGEGIALSVDGDPCTFRELEDWSARIAVRLGELGVRPGDRVAMIGMNSLNYAALAFGVMRIGAIGAPVSFRSTAHEATIAFSDTTPSILFSDAARKPVADEAGAKAGGLPVHTMEEIGALRRGSPVAFTFSPHPDDPVFIIGTSGSTGRPKGVVYSHRTVVSYAAEFGICEPRCGRGSRVFSPGPFSSSSGYLLLMQFIALGATLFIESHFDPVRALEIISTHKITTFQGAPIFFERISALPAFQTADLGSLYWAHAAGSPVSQNLLRTWLDKGVLLRHAYGSTEAGGGWAARKDTALTEPEKCGRGGMFTEYAIRAPDGGMAPAGVEGEILVRSACMTPGYWNNPTATAEAIEDGWLHTGDVGALDENGNLTFRDRLKDIIISGGLNISAREIEQTIAEVDGVREVAVIAIADAAFGETPLAIVHGDATLSVQAIVAHCAARLAGYKAPRYIDIAPDPLPRLMSGKIAKPALRDIYKDAHLRLEKVR